jgi:hypothetical protein
MNLRNWLSERRLRPLQTSAQEIAALMHMVDRDLSDAVVSGVSIDRRFTVAYDAALTLATMVLRSAGYRTSGPGHHWLTFEMLPELMGETERGRARYFDSCRTKRNRASYDCPGMISESEAREILREVTTFKSDVLHWLEDNHPDLCTGFE